MSAIRVFFSCIPQFFCFLWAAFIGIFVSDVRTNSKSVDIETGTPAESDVKEIPPCRHSLQLDLESGIHCLRCHPSDFVEIDINSQSRPLSSNGTQVIEDTIAFGSPIRRTSCHLDPLQFDAVDTASESVQDKMTSVFRPVIVTPDYTIRACSTEVEYYYGPPIEPCSAQIEHFDDRDVSTSMPNGTEASRAEIQFSPSSPHSVSNAESFSPTLAIVEEESGSSFGIDKCVNDKTLSELPTFPFKPSLVRSELLDLINQFPDVPRYLPPCPKALAANLALFKTDPDVSTSRDATFSSPTSSEKSTPTSISGCSGNMESGYGGDETPNTSIPASPQTQSDESFFAVPGQAVPISQKKKEGTANFRLESEFSGPGRARASQAESLRWSRLEYSGVNAARKAMARAVLSGYQSDESDVGVDSILELLEGSSFGSSQGKRPESLMWFAEADTDATFDFPATLAESKMEQPTALKEVAPLRIVKKSKVQDDEDEVVARELLRWEDSRRLGLKAFREADAQDMDFFDLSSGGT